MQDPDQEGRHTRASGIPGSAPQARGRAIARIITRSLATPEAVEEANYRRYLSAAPERLDDLTAASLADNVTGMIGRSHSSSFDQRRRPETLRTAMATAFFWPTSTTRRLPRVMPV